MWLERRSGSCVHFSRLFLNLWLLLSCLAYATVSGQKCESGFEGSCIWRHEPSSTLTWKLKGDINGVFYVEVTGCQKPDCGIGMLQSPWLPARTSPLTHTLEYKIYGTSKVFLRVNLRLDDEQATIRQLFSKAGNYAYGWPKEDEWSSGSLTIPPTNTRYQLLIKAYTPYFQAMVAVKGINLEEDFVITSTRSASKTTSRTTTTTIKPATARPPPRTTRTSTTTTTTTTTAKPDDDDGEIFPTHSLPDIKIYSTGFSGTSDDIDYFPDDDDYEDDVMLQALEIENFITEEDMVKGYTTVVEPQICPYKR